MRVKQTIPLEFQNTPIGAPPAGCSVNLSLNSCQSDSVVDGVVGALAPSTQTGLDHAEVDQQEGQPEKGISNEVPFINVQRVFVLSYKGEPLIPCSPRKARKLLKEGKAVVVSARPFFVIKLNYNTGGAKQPINLGIDPGYEFI